MPSVLEHSIYIGAGDVLVRDLSDPTNGFEPLGNCSSFTLQPKVVKIEDKSHMMHTYGNVVASMDLPDGVDISMTLTKYSKLVWATALGAEVQALTQSAESDLSASLVLPHGQYVLLPHVNVTNVSCQEDSVVGEEGLDYKLDPVAGMIMSLATGAFTDRASIQVAYDTLELAVDAYELIGGKKGSVEVGIFVNGINKYTGRRHLVEIPKATFAPNEATQLITGQEKGSATLSGQIMVEGDSELFTQRML